MRARPRFQAPRLGRRLTAPRLAGRPRQPERKGENSFFPLVLFYIGPPLTAEALSAGKRRASGSW